MIEQVTKRTWNHWTDNEVDTLRREWPDSNIVALQRLIPNHGGRSINHKAYELLLKKNPRHSGRRLHKPIWEFWDTWSGDLAYLIGLLAADGTIHHTSNQHGVSLTLKASDESLLQRIKLIAGGYVFPHRCVSAASWRLAGKDVTRKLVDLGIVPQKTFRQVLPYIPTEYENHFIRGYFDGDGWATQCIVNNTWIGYTIGFCGNEQFMTGIRDLLESKFKFAATYIKNRPIAKLPDANVWRLTLHNKIVIREVSSWMYYAANLCLERKRSIIERWGERWKSQN